MNEYIKVDLRVESRNIKVHFECPHCKEDIERDYQNFCSDVGEPCDWSYTRFDCPECENEIEIDDVEWD